MAKKPIVWVIDDDDSIRWVLEKGLTESNLEVVTFDRANNCLLYTSPSPRDRG